MKKEPTSEIQCQMVKDVIMYPDVNITRTENALTIVEKMYKDCCRMFQALEEIDSDEHYKYDLNNKTAEKAISQVSDYPIKNV